MQNCTSPSYLEPLNFATLGSEAKLIEKYVQIDRTDPNCNLTFQTKSIQMQPMVPIPTAIFSNHHKNSARQTLHPRIRGQYVPPCCSISAKLNY
ncbi:MAG: hypothetical protein CL912_28735 [Deltaproteobacteria bacterium]|nr:hypothetical protein [Deltaproteobacteria bacterium]